jgi:hypothetical protein
MAATTTLLGLVTPTQGTLSGTWGDTVNYGISDYVDISVAGTLTLTNDGAVTLANTTGSSSGNSITSSLTGAGTVTAQFAIVKVTGTLTTAKVVTGPSYSKTYTVVNSATGGIVTFKASGQTGVSIAVGESAFVYFNGTDYVKVSGTVAVASFQTSLGGLTPSTATTGVVTLAGTLNTTSGGTGLTSFTAGDVPYYASGSVLSKLAIGTAGQFLTSTGTAPQWSTLSGVAVTTFSAGTTGFTPSSATSGAVTLAGTLNVANGGTGLTSLTAGYIPFGAGTSAFGNSANLFWDNTNGRLGIGTNSPSTILTVNAGINAGFLSLTSSTTPTSSDQRLFAIGAGSVTDTNKARIQFYVSGAWTDGVSTPTYITLSTTPASSITAAERMRINSSGNVGIGNTISAWGSGITSLQIGNYSALTNNQGGYVWLSSNGFYDTAWKYLTTNRALYYAQDVSDGGHKWFNAASGTAGDAITFTQAMTLDASRRLMIDTTTIGIGASGFSLLNVGGAQASSFQSIKASGGEELILGVAAGAAFMGSYSNTALNFRSNNTNQMTLSTAGNLGLGVTPSAWNTNLKAIELKTVGNSIMSGGSSDMYVTSNAYFNASNSWIYANTAAASIYQLASGQHRWSVAASGTAGNAVGFTQAMTLDASGNLVIGNTSASARLHIDSGSTALMSVFNSTNANGGYFTGYSSSTAVWDIGTAKQTLNVGASTDLGINVRSGFLALGTGNTERARIDSSGNLLVGGTAQSGAANRTAVFSANKFGLSVIDTTAQAAGVGGALNLGGNYRTTGDAQAFCRVAAAKENSTDGNFAYAMTFATTPNGGTFTERARIDSSGNLLVGGTAARGTTVGTAHLDLFNGTAPAGTLTDGVSLYSSSGDLRFMDAAGNAFDVGYRNIPQNSQSANYTLVLGDAGDHIFHPVGDNNARTFTIPANSSVAFPIGTAITFINMAAANVTIAITTDTMYLSSAGTTGSRTLAQYGSATAIKITSTNWLISGSGLT